MLKYFLALLLMASTVSATIVKTDTFLPFFLECESFTEKSLVVLDVDRVLIEPRDAIMRFPNQRLLWELHHKYANRLSPQEMADRSSIVSLQESSVLVDPLAIIFINYLKSKKVPVIALTATGVTGFGRIASIPDWRVRDLERFGISFATSFQEFSPFILTELNTRGPSPVFKSGCLFTGGYNKGDVLEAFLDIVDFLPDKVLFADDLQLNLVSVETSLNEMGIQDVRAFQYLGADKIPNTIDPKIADFQIKTLMHEKQWLSDEQAKEKLSLGALNQAKL